MTALPRTALLAALALCVCLNLPLQWAGDLGYYDNDYNHLLALVDRPLHFWRHLLTDEPLFNVYHAMRYRLFGPEPFAHHAAQATVLTINALLAFTLVWRLSSQLLLCFLFLLLFLTQPGHPEAYYWVAAVYHVMLLSLLAAAHLCLTWLRSGRQAALLGFWACYAAAVFTHEAASGFLGAFVALWALERRQTGLRFALPLALVNAAYLVVRQTHWFGFGDPVFARARPLQLGRVWGNLVSSLDANFGPSFLRSAGELAREGSTWVIWLTITAAAVLIAALCGGERRQRLLSMAPVIGLGLIAARIDPQLGLHLAVLASALLALIGFARTRRIPSLAFWAAAWFLFAYLPTYPLYIENRHHYLPSLGTCLLMALGLMLGAGFRAATVRERGRPRLEGLALALAACLAVGFHSAGSAEARRWVDAAHYTASLRAQLQQAWPALPAGARVIILGLPNVRNGVPLLPDYAADAALRFWYRHPDILTHPGFVPRRADFRFHGTEGEHPHPYDRLLLFRYDHLKLMQIRELVFEDGARVRLGEALPAPSGHLLTGSLQVTTGRSPNHQITRSPD